MCPDRSPRADRRCERAGAAARDDLAHDEPEHALMIGARAFLQGCRLVDVELRAVRNVACAGWDLGDDPERIARRRGRASRKIECADGLGARECREIALARAARAQDPPIRRLAEPADRGLELRLLLGLRFDERASIVVEADRARKVRALDERHETVIGFLRIVEGHAEHAVAEIAHRVRSPLALAERAIVDESVVGGDA